jgi:hypothetical protein
MNLLVEMAQVDTGHFCLMKTPRPGRIPLQAAAPFQSKIFFNGASEVSWFAGTEPLGGTYISWKYVNYEIVRMCTIFITSKHGIGGGYQISRNFVYNLV